MSAAGRVVLCGPFPSGGKMGGYARANELTARSALRDTFGVERLPVTVPGDGSMAARMLEDVRRTRRCLRGRRSGVFHLTAQYERGTYREYVQFRMARRAGLRFVYDIRAGCFVESYQSSGSLRRRLLDQLIRGADAIAVEGRPYRIWLRERFGRDAFWLPNYVLAADRERFPRATLEPLREGELRVAYAGRLVAEKGLEELVSACARLAQRGVRVELHLFGEGEPAFDRQLRERAAAEGVAERVVFHGALEHGEVLRGIARHHVFAYPTRWSGEGHSNAVNEAMQVGLPVVTTRQGFLADVVTEECGALVTPESAEELADALEGFARDPEALLRKGEAAHARVYRLFSDEAVLPALAALYRRLLGQRADGEPRVAGVGASGAAG